MYLFYKNTLNRYLLILLFVVVSTSSVFSYELDWEASATVNAGSGSFAPSLIMANRGGTISHSNGLYDRVGFFHRLDPERRFSYSFGVDAYLQSTSSIDYMKWNTDRREFLLVALRPSDAVIQQLYGLIKYRSLFLSVGMKEHDRTFLNNPLSSGDITLSNNARPIPQVRAGFYDFVDIPFTQGWVQIIGDIAYGKFMDSNWNKNHYNYYNSFLTTDVWFHYKRLYLRSNPKQRFVATAGMQHAAQFNGEYKIYRRGECVEVYKPEHFLRSFLDVFVQAQYNSSHIDGESMNFIGNHLGSWDAKFDYRLKNNDIVSFYVMKPWEDGTGIGWQNGFDGVWGLSYKPSANKYIKGTVIEYLDFTNQSGSFLYEPNENIPTNTTGGDDYYNNFMYNGWTNYGMGLGSPALKSTIYNTDGYLIYLDNAVRGFHMGIDGTVGNVDLRMLLSWKESKGTHYYPRAKRLKSTSMMVEGEYGFPRAEGLSLKAQVGFDAGDLYPSCFGVLLSLSYKGKVKTKSKVK